MVIIDNHLIQVCICSKPFALDFSLATSTDYLVLQRGWLRTAWWLTDAEGLQRRCTRASPGDKIQPIHATEHV